MTNGVTQYLDIIAKADYYLSILHYLWVTSELSDSPDEARRVKLNTERATSAITCLALLGRAIRTTKTSAASVTVSSKRRQDRLCAGRAGPARSAEKAAKKLAEEEQAQAAKALSEKAQDRGQETLAAAQGDL